MAESYVHRQKTLQSSIIIHRQVSVTIKIMHKSLVDKLVPSVI